MFGQKYPQILELNRNLHWHLFYASNCYRIKLMRQIIIMKHINLNSFSEILINYNESFIRKKFSTLFNWIISIWIHTRNKYFIGAMQNFKQRNISYPMHNFSNIAKDCGFCSVYDTKNLGTAISLPFNVYFIVYIIK